MVNLGAMIVICGSITLAFHLKLLSRLRADPFGVYGDGCHPLDNKEVRVMFAAIDKSRDQAVSVEDIVTYLQDVHSGTGEASDCVANPTSKNEIVKHLEQK